MHLRPGGVTLSSLSRSLFKKAPGIFYADIPPSFGKAIFTIGEPSGKGGLPDEIRKKRFLLSSLGGLACGVANGLLGAGGGMVAVPMLQKKRPQRG